MMLLSTSQPSYLCPIWVMKLMPRSGHTLPFSLPSPPAHISFSPGQKRTRKEPWKRLEWWVLRSSQGSSKTVLYIAEIKHTIHSILTPRSETCQRLHGYQALHKLTRHLQYPALPNWEKSWLNGNTKTHCNRTPSMSKCCLLPLCHTVPAASLTSSLTAPSSKGSCLPLWPHINDGCAEGWPGAGLCCSPCGAPGLPCMSQGTAWWDRKTIKMERGCHTLISLFWDGQAICIRVAYRDHIPTSYLAPPPQLQSRWAHP